MSRYSADFKAVQFTGKNGPELAKWCGAILDSEAKATDHTEVYLVLKMKFPEGTRTVRPGDWIVFSATGFHPCSDDMFKKTYMKVG